MRVGAAKERKETDVDLDDLRRRLYRAEATDGDLRRYLDERAAVVPPEASAPAPVRRRPRRRITVLAAVGVTVVLAVAVGVLLQQPAFAPGRPVAEQAPSTVSLDAGGGRLLAVDPTRLSGPKRTAVMVEGAETAAQQFEGVGNEIVPVALPGAEFGTQRAVVILYSNRTSTISWRALRPVTRRDWSSYQQVVATGRITSHIDFDVPDTFSYAGAPPTRIVVQAPADLHWTLLVAAANGPTSGLR